LIYIYIYIYIYVCYDCGEEVVDLDPRHPYGYLVPDELAARYAAAEKELAAVVALIKTHPLDTGRKEK
jgi:hypothetical protein